MIGLLTQLVTLAIAVVPLYLLLRKTRADAVLAAKAAAEVHAIVNSQRDAMRRYQAVLEAALRAAGVDVPPDASLDPNTQKEAP